MVITLLDFVNHGGLGVVAYVGNYSHIRIERATDHFSTTKPNFLLNRINDVKRERQLLFILVKESCHFGDHETTRPVVKGTPYIIFFIEDHKLIFESHHAPNMNSE